MRTPPPAAIAARLKVALRAAEQAGAIVVGHLGRLEHIDHKSPIDLVTIADRQSEAAILAELHGAFPADAVLAEERDGAAGAAALRDQVAEIAWMWAVDPLDGTTNFAHGYPAWCVSIGLLHYGLPVLGVVLIPPRRELFVGGLGVPATRNGQPIAVSAVADLGQALIGTGFPYDRRSRLPQLLGWLGEMLRLAHCVRRSGSAALDLCDLACGRLDGFYEIGLRPWDLAAGQAIVSAAGGRLTDLAGQPHDPFAAATVGSNSKIHQQLCDALGSAWPPKRANAVGDG